VADDALTEREIQVLRRVAAGKSNKVIAAELDISEGTVKTHMKSILQKLDASDRTHAVNDRPEAGNFRRLNAGGNGRLGSDYSARPECLNRAVSMTPGQPVAVGKRPYSLPIQAKSEQAAIDQGARYCR